MEAKDIIYTSEDADEYSRAIRSGDQELLKKQVAKIRRQELLLLNHPPMNCVKCKKDRAAEEFLPQVIFQHQKICECGCGREGVGAIFSLEKGRICGQCCALVIFDRLDPIQKLMALAMKDQADTLRGRAEQELNAVN